MNKIARSSLLLRLSALGALVFILACSAGAALFADRAVTQLSSKRFDQTVSALNTHVMERMEQYSNLLYGGRSYILNSKTIDQPAWDRFFRDQAAFQNYPGVSTISYLQYFDNAQKDAFLATMRAQPYFGGSAFSIRPEGTRDQYAVIRLVASNNADVKRTFGFDVFSSAPQRRAMELTAQTGRPQATEPYALASGFGGFAVFLPVYKNGRLDGFGLLSFRTADFIKALFGEDYPSFDGLRYKITDTTDPDQPRLLYASPGAAGAKQIQRADTVSVLGRTWQLTFMADQNYNVSWLAQMVPSLVLTLGVLVSLPLHMSLRRVKRKHRSLTRRSSNS